MEDIANDMPYSFAAASLQQRPQANDNRLTRYLVADMRIERYYATLREDSSQLTENALTLLQTQNYAGFFLSCGATFVRSIRRAQEVTAILEFESPNVEQAQAFSNNIQLSAWERVPMTSSFNPLTDTLDITIQGYGLGLTAEGSETLMASSLEELFDAMRFAYRLMTSSGVVTVGMIYGMEVSPWVDHTNFMLNSGVNDEVIEVPVLRNSIPRAYKIDDKYDTEFNNEERELYRCKASDYSIDKFGNCCADDELYDHEVGLYNSTSPEEHVCRPMRQLDRTMVRENLMLNGEFTSRLSRALRLKTERIGALSNCISAVNTLSERFEFNYLKPTGDSGYGSSLGNMLFTVFELKIGIDPFNDGEMVKQLSKEVDEFATMFYQPCMAAIYGSNSGVSPNTEVNQFMAHPWHSHSECSKVSCLLNGMRWDRDNGGCVPGLTSGTAAAAYSADGGDYCQVDSDNSQEELQCRNSSVDLNDFQGRVIACWENFAPTGSIDFFLDNFCAPEITAQVLNADAQFQLRQDFMASCTELEEKTMNVALNRPAMQSETYTGSIKGTASKAVDGKKDGYWHRKGVSHTGYSKYRDQTGYQDPWWYVNLGDAFTIKEIIVYNRKDYKPERISDFVLKIYRNDSVEWTYTHSGTPDHRTVITVPEVIGDKVQIELVGEERVLQLAEVEVWNKYYD